MNEEVEPKIKNRGGHLSTDNDEVVNHSNNTHSASVPAWNDIRTHLF
jgi:hypothetical protein